MAVLTFASVGAANKVLKKLDKHEMHGQQLSLRPFHPERALKGRGARKHGEGADAGTAEGGGAVGAMLRGQAKRNSRVIVRNLSFKATEQELRKQLGAFGPVLEASIPTVRVMEGREGRRGFGFVTFACAKDAARAAAADGVSVCGREVAVDMCMGKREYQEQRDKERQDKAEAEGVKEEVVVKEEVESEGEGAGEEEHGMVVENDEDDGSEGEEGSDDEDEEEEAEEESEQEGEEEKKPAKASDVGEGKTLFVRNVPFDATNESLKDAFGTLAAVAFAVTVRDRATGMSKGTAFVKCKNAKGVEAVLAAAKAEGGVLTLLGRPLRVDRAVEREEAPQPKLVEEGKEGGAGGGGGAQRKWRVDRRNLYLANEGLVLDSEAQDAIPRSDVEKRQREQADKKSKLRNPFFFVSPTRLAIRNLGRAVLDADVRGALLKAAVQGLEQGKVAVEDMKMHLHAQGKHEEALDPKCTLVRVPKPKEVSLKVKVLRDLDKKPVDGVHPSRGYGFADFGSHAHALAALRVVNNNPAFGKLAGGAKDAERRRPRLIVSFAIENHKALHKKKLREEKGKATTAASAAAATALGKRGRSDSQGSLEEGADGGGGDDEGEKKPNRGQRQRENKRRQKELGVLPAPKAAKASRAGGSEPRAGKAARDGAGRKRKEPSGSEAPSHARHHAKQQTPPRDELDALLGDQPAGEAGKTKKGKRGKHGQQRMTQEDRSFEASVSFHKQKLQQRGGGGGGAGAGAGAAGGAAGAGAKKESNRWFQD